MLWLCVGLKESSNSYLPAKPFGKFDTAFSYCAGSKMLINRVTMQAITAIYLIKNDIF